MYPVKFYYEIRIKDSAIPMKHICLNYNTKLPFVPTKEICIDNLPGVDYPCEIRFIVYDNVKNVFKCVLTQTEERKITLINHVKTMKMAGWKIDSENEKNMEMILNA